MATTLTIDPQHLKGRHVDRAVEVLKRDGVIVYPTDTIYGLGCDVTSKAAVERIRRIKGRDADKPMSFVCSDLVQVSRYGHVSNFVHRILKRFLPGPYTFVLAATKETPRVLQSKQKTVGIRIPGSPCTAGAGGAARQPRGQHQRQREQRGRCHQPGRPGTDFRTPGGPHHGMRNPAGPGVQRDLARERQYRDPARRAGGSELLQEASPDFVRAGPFTARASCDQPCR